MAEVHARLALVALPGEDERPGGRTAKAVSGNGRPPSHRPRRIAGLRISTAVRRLDHAVVPHGDGLSSSDFSIVSVHKLFRAGEPFRFQAQTPNSTYSIKRRGTRIDPATLRLIGAFLASPQGSPTATRDKRCTTSP